MKSSDHHYGFVDFSAMTTQSVLRSGPARGRNTFATYALCIVLTSTRAFADSYLSCQVQDKAVREHTADYQLLQTKTDGKTQSICITEATVDEEAVIQMC